MSISPYYYKVFTTIILKTILFFHIGDFLKRGAGGVACCVFHQKDCLHRLLPSHKREHISTGEA